MPDEHDSGHVSTNAAEIYEAFFVPALFAPFTGPLLAAAGVARGDAVLDVACGTGVAARAAASAVGSEGAVTGVDLNPAMLAVASERAPRIAFDEAAAESLPFTAASFDRVLCQFALMFFADRSAALTEMRRVLRPGGRAALAVWAALTDTPGYLAMHGLLREILGAQAARSVAVPYCLGDPAALSTTLASAGIGDARITTVTGIARFASLDAWLTTDIRGWTLADSVGDDAFTALRAAAPAHLARFVQDNGTVAFAAPAHLVSFGKT